MTAARKALPLIPVIMMALALSVGWTSPVHAAPDKRELQAREDYAAGRYKEALELFAKLYAEKLHPNYLRNIGRCYQNLGEPDRAITSYREYLRKAKGISADERAEVDGYIKEMETLAAQRKNAAAAEPPPPAKPPATTTPAPTLTAVPPPDQNDAPMVIKNKPPVSTPDEGEAPVYKKVWFWAVIGGVVLTGVGLAAAGVFTSHKDAPCAADRMCQ